MSVTWIEVVDTAVKIGLGGIITGILAIAINERKTSSDTQKEKSAETKELLKTLINKADTATEKFVRCANCYKEHFEWLQVEGQTRPNVKDGAIDLEIESKQLMGEAGTLATLLGEKGIRDLCHEADTIIFNTVAIFRQVDEKYDKQKIQELAVEYNEKLEEIHNLIEYAYAAYVVPRITGSSTVKNSN